MNQISLRMAAFCLVLILSCLLLVSCSESDDVIIGGVLVLSTEKGDVVETGHGTLTGMKLAIEAVNTNGGVRGRNIRFVFEDSESNAEKARSIYRKLAAQSPVAIITMYSHISKALTPLSTEFKIPQLAIVATAEDLLRDAPYTFRYWPRSSLEVKATFPIINKLKVRRLGLVNSDNDYGNSVAAEFIKQATGTGLEVKKVKYINIDENLAANLVALKECDAISFTCYPQDVLELTKLIRKELPGKPIIGPNTVSSPMFSSAPELDGVYTPAPLVYNPAFPYAVDVGREYREKYETPLSQYSAIGYDSINLLAQLLVKSGPSSEALEAELESAFIYPGLFGDVVKEEGSHNFSFPLYPSRILNKKVVYQDR